MSGALDVSGSVRELDGLAAGLRGGFGMGKVNCERFRRSARERCRD